MLLDVILVMSYGLGLTWILAFSKNTQNLKEVFTRSYVCEAVWAQGTWYRALLRAALQYPPSSPSRPAVLRWNWIVRRQSRWSRCDAVGMYTNNYYTYHLSGPENAEDNGNVSSISIQYSYMYFNEIDCTNFDWSRDQDTLPCTAYPQRM